MKKLSHQFDLNSMQNCRKNIKCAEMAGFSTPFQHAFTKDVSFLMKLRVKNPSFLGGKEPSFKRKGMYYPLCSLVEYHVLCHMEKFHANWR